MSLPRLGRFGVRLATCLAVGGYSADTSASPWEPDSWSTTLDTSSNTSEGESTDWNRCSSVQVNRSVVIHDQATIDGLFGFEKVIDAIRRSSRGRTTTNAQLAQTLTSGLLTDPFTQPVSGLPMPAQLRTPEAGLTGNDLLTQMQPIALFNRFDLAPADGSNCGEYRIVYGRYPNAATDRYLLIFESVLPNPNPRSGIRGCLPVAEFWHWLSNPRVTTADRRRALESFYFRGLRGFGPVVRHANYGFPHGQVRSNMFVDAAVLNFSWQLREWKTNFDNAGRPVFVPNPVGDNPLAEFYDEASSNPNPAQFTSEQRAFVAHFQNDVLSNLLAFELANPGFATCPQVNAITAGFSERFNEFQGTAGPTGVDDPSAIASPDFRRTVASAIPATVSGVTAEHVINRGNAMTCAGCHEVSNGDPISSNATWPNSLGFVHVNELGASPPSVAPLSPALNQCFLPARQQVLEEFVCGRGASAAISLSCASAVGGDCGELLQSRITQSTDILLTSSDEQARVTARADLDAAVAEARARQRSKPGAFVPVRRTH